LIFIPTKKLKEKFIMNKQILLFVFLIMALFLMVGCDTSHIITAPTPEETAVKNAVYGYYQEQSNLRWAKAKDYCLEDSQAYLDVVQMQAAVTDLSLYCDNVVLSITVNIQNVVINGDYATVSGHASKLLTYCNYYAPKEEDFSWNLQNISNKWTLY